MEFNLAGIDLDTLHAEYAKFCKQNSHTAMKTAGLVAGGLIISRAFLFLLEKDEGKGMAPAVTFIGGVFILFLSFGAGKINPNGLLRIVRERANIMLIMALIVCTYFILISITDPYVKFRTSMSLALTIQFFAIVLHCTLGETLLAYGVYIGVIASMYHGSLKEAAIDSLKDAILLTFCIRSQRIMEAESLDRYHSNKKLEQSSKMLISFFNSSSNWVFFVSKKTKEILFSNTATRRDNGNVATFDELCGKLPRVRSLDDVLLTDFLKNIIESPHLSKGEYENTFQSKTKYFQLSIIQAEDDNDSIGVWLKDQTEKRRKEEERAINDYKERMICTISHEIRTPLIAVVGALQLLKTRVKSKEKRQLIKSALASVGHLQYYIADMMDYLNHFSKKFHLHVKRFKIKELIHKVEKLFLNQLAKTVDLQVKIDESIPPEFQSDDERITQILVNLITNSIKFTQHGHICLTARVIEGNFQFRVADTGMGMPPHLVEQLNLLFAGKNVEQPFKMEEGPRKATSLAGMGLQIVAMIAHYLDCVITVKSEEREGTEITVDFPLNAILPDDIQSLRYNSLEKGECLAPSSPGADDPPEERTQKANDTCNAGSVIYSASKPRVLLVDDNATNLRVIHALFGKFKVSISESRNGQEAVDSVERARGNFRLIMMDINMPIMDGVTASEIIHKKYPKISIVAATAYASEVDRESCLDVGMSAYYTKPLSKKNVQEIISLYL